MKMKLAVLGHYDNYKTDTKEYSIYVNKPEDCVGYFKSLCEAGRDKDGFRPCDLISFEGEK